MILYHGTSEDITNFGHPPNHLKWGFGTYFYPKLEMSSLFCLNKWWNLESGLKDNAVVYECEVDIQVNQLYKMTPLMASMIHSQIRDKYSGDAIYNQHCDIALSICRRGYHGILIERGLKNEIFGGKNINMLDVNEYKYEQYCIITPNLVTIKDILQPKFWDPEMYKFEVS